MKSAGFTRLLLRIVTSRRSGGLLGEWGAAGAAKVPTLRGQEPSFPPRQSGVVHRPRGPKISPEHSLPAMAVGIVRLWVVSSRHRGDVGLSTYRQPIIPLTNTRTFLTLPPVADVGTSDDSVSELVGTHALRRGLRCCLSSGALSPDALGFRRGERHESRLGRHRSSPCARERLRAPGLD